MADTLPLFHLYPICTLCTPDILKINTVKGFKIISCLGNNLQNHRRFPVCRNKRFEEGLLEGLSQLVSVVLVKIMEVLAKA